MTYWRKGLTWEHLVCVLECFWVQNLIFTGSDPIFWRPLAQWSGFYGADLFMFSSVQICINDEYSLKLRIDPNITQRRKQFICYVAGRRSSQRSKMTRTIITKYLLINQMPYQVWEVRLLLLMIQLPRSPPKPWLIKLKLIPLAAIPP